MQNALARSPLSSSEAIVQYPYRWQNVPEKGTERLLVGQNRGRPTAPATSAAMLMSISCSPVGTQQSRAGITGQVDDRHSPAAITKGTTSPPSHEKAGSKHTQPELDREAPPARCLHAELSECDPIPIGGESVRPCVTLHGCSPESTVDAARSDESQAKKGTQPPPIASARSGPDCLLVSTPRDTSSIRAGTQGVGPQAGKG